MYNLSTQAGVKFRHFTRVVFTNYKKKINSDVPLDCLSIYMYIEKYEAHTCIKEI